jgi:CRP-like cAMP-binding protein
LNLEPNPFAGIEAIERRPAGRVLFREGDQPLGVFVIHSGAVDLVFSARNGLRKALRTAHPGDVVGLSEAISDSLHGYTATARRRSRIGFVPLTELRRMLESTPSMWLAVAKHLSSDLGACWESLKKLA